MRVAVGRPVVRTRRSTPTFSRLDDVSTRVNYTWQYYDLVLVGIAVSVVVGGVVGYATGASLPLAVAATSLLAVVFILHGLFVNGPVDEPGDLRDEVEALN